MHDEFHKIILLARALAPEHIPHALHLHQSESGRSNNVMHVFVACNVDDLYLHMRCDDLYLLRLRPFHALIWFQITGF